jgi:uncharacterized protein
MRLSKQLVPVAVVFWLLLTGVFRWPARRRGTLVPLRRGATATLAR